MTTKDKLTAVKFTEDFKVTSRNQLLVFSGKSYMRWCRAVLPMLSKVPELPLGVVKGATEVGDFRFYRATMPMWTDVFPFPFSKRSYSKRSRLDIWGHGKAQCEFDCDVWIPVLANDRGQPWMSLTPNEILSQQKLIKYAKGDVGIAGMGLGWLSRRVLEKPDVHSLTVYDIRTEVLQYFGAPLLQLAAKLNKPLNFVEADAYEVDWFRHTCALWDIWKDGSDGSDDVRFWTICQQLRDEKIRCHGWRTVKPSSYCQRRLELACKSPVS